MLSIAIVVFREILEIALIVTTLLAATCRVTQRNKWINIGLVAGVIGSCIVAYFAEQISQLAEGMGQEIFNATVLILASVLIGWTVVWMRRHGREITQHMKEIGHDVLAGKKPLYTLAVIVALSVLREGSEIVLFSYGIIASGESISSLVVGGICGLTAGIIIGVGLYFGLVKISPKYLFSVTSWLLIFVAAGMVSESVGLLQASGMISVLAGNLWDTSHILSESSFLGRVLHTLIGYTARPSAFQVAGYVATFVSIALFLRFYGGAASKQIRVKNTVMAAVIILAVALGICGDAHSRLISNKDMGLFLAVPIK